MRRILLITFLVLLLPNQLFATSIVAIIDQRSVTIVADGVLIGYSSDKAKIVRTTICKIRCAGRACFAASGRYNEATIGYDLFPLAEEELNRDGTPEEISERFMSVIEPLVPDIIAVAKQETPDRYAEWLKGLPVLSYFFAGFGNNRKAVIAGGDILLDNKGRVRPIHKSVWRGESGKIEVVRLGWSEHIGAFMSSNPMWGYSAVANPSEFGKKMVQIEAEASESSGRRDVGDPIAIVRLTAEMGFKLDTMGACKEN